MYSMIDGTRSTSRTFNITSPIDILQTGSIIRPAAKRCRKWAQSRSQKTTV